jgi:hypothetical protein
MKTLILILIPFLLASCTTTREVMDSWVGHSKHELLMSNGSPNQISGDGNGGEILTYVYQSSFYGNVKNVYKHFYCDSNGKIYHWLVQDRPVPPTQVIIKTQPQSPTLKIPSYGY